MEGLLFGDTSIGDVLRQSGASAFGLGTLNGLDGEVPPGSLANSATATIFSCLVSTALYKVIYQLQEVCPRSWPCRAPAQSSLLMYRLKLEGRA